MIKRKPPKPKHPLGRRHTNKFYQGLLPYFFIICVVICYIFYIYLAETILNLVTPLVLGALIVGGFILWARR